ncbi:MAG: hypothetical protein WC028_20915 [Candidatus Obscuribacterales bacterium]
MARPRRKRAEIDAALASAERSCADSLAQLCRDVRPGSRERTERLVELIESLAATMVGQRKAKNNEALAQERHLLELSKQFVARQLELLDEQNLKFASSAGLQAFFLLQLFERLRQEVMPSLKDQYDRRANAAYFTPIGLSYYLAKEAFSGKEIDPDNLRVLDFCAGSGSLSIAALDYLSAAATTTTSSSSSLSPLSFCGAERLRLLGKHIFAVEIDPLILRTYVACLSVACSASIEETMRVAGENFSEADGLATSLPLCDILLANPPWEGSSYLQFVEKAGQLLAPSGLAVVLTPSGIASDQGAANLRRMLFEDYQWQSLEGFINEDLAFPIHTSYKYALSVFSRPQQLQQQPNEAKATTRVRFGSLATNLLTSDKNSWSNYSFALAQTLSPSSFAILESDAGEQFALFQSIAANNAALHQLHEDGKMQMDRGRYKQEKKPSNLVAYGHGNYSLRFARDYDMSIDKNLFIGSLEAKRAGFRPDCYGRFLQGKWIDIGDGPLASAAALSEPGVILSQDFSSYIERDRVEECLLPLIEGRMVGPFEIASKVYISGRGRQALWRENSANIISTNINSSGQAVGSWPSFSSQYLLRESDFCLRRTAIDCSRVGFVSVSAATNTRSMIAALLPSFPAGNSVPFLSVAAANESERAYWALIMVAVFNSFVFDFVLRTRFGGNNLNYFLLDQCAVPQLLLAARERDICDPVLNLIAQVSALLSFTHLSLAPRVLAYLDGRSGLGLFAAELAGVEEKVPGHSFVGLPWPQRQRLRALLDALVARLYGLDSGQFAQLLSGCSGVGPSPVNSLGNSAGNGAGDCREHCRGFHRVDKQLPFDQRLPYLAYQFFQDIEMNRLDLNQLAGHGFSALGGSNGQGLSLQADDKGLSEEYLREQMVWLKMHQNRLDPFHQKSGVK